MYASEQTLSDYIFMSCTERRFSSPTEAQKTRRLKVEPWLTIIIASTTKMSHSKRGLESATTEHNESPICRLIPQEALQTTMSEHRICRGCITRLTRYG